MKYDYSEEEGKIVFSDRRPHNSDKIFAPGEFTKLFQKALETVDLIFSEGIEWTAFLDSFQQLQTEVKSEDLAIQAIEKKSGGAFVVRLEVPEEANKAEIQKYIEREYEAKLKVIEEKYRVQLNAKKEQIEIYKQNSANIMKMAELVAKASQPTIIQTNIDNQNLQGDRNTHLEKGNYNENTQGNYYEQGGN